MSTLTAKAFRVFVDNYNEKTYTGKIECRESGRLIWSEECDTVRLTKKDALIDANKLLYFHEGNTLHCDKVNWQYAKV